MRKVFTNVSLVLLAAWVAYGCGQMAAESPAQRKALIAAHNDAVVACVEQAAKRYSVCLDGDQNLLPEWAQGERIPMADLDAYYRDPELGWPVREDDVPYQHYATK